MYRPAASLIRDALPKDCGDTVDMSLSNKFLMPSKTFIAEKVSNEASTWLNATYELILKNECSEES